MPYMKILLTNDDGYGAEGLEVLAKRLSVENEVWIVAPHKNRSGVSHCITMQKPLCLEEHGKKRYSLEGFPADCVITSLKGDFIGTRPDIVVSGINNDANLGTDVLYSGTCAAARQASLYGVPGIALSLCGKESHNSGENKFEALADFAAKNLEELSKLCGEKQNETCGGYKYFVSVNALSLDKYKGVKFTGLSNREYRDSVEIHTAADEKKYSVFSGGEIISHGDENNDAAVVKEGYVSISVVNTQPVCNNVTNDVAGRFFI